VNLLILRHTIDTYRQWIMQGKLKIRFSKVQQLIEHGEMEKGPMAPDVEEPKTDTVEIVQRAIVLR